MTYTRVVFWKSFVFFYFILILLSPNPICGQARPGIVQRVDNDQRITLKGNIHPMATVQNDRGAVSDAQPIGRILLLLKRSEEQQSALSSFMEQQQDKSSPNYHHWLAPAEFGAQYGVADADIQAVTQWLTQQGFQVNQVYSSKMEIEFSGSAAQVRSAFGTDLRNFQVGANTYMANSADPQIPAALAPVIAGIVSLNNFPRQSYVRRLGQFRREKGQSAAKPLVTVSSPFGGNFYAMGPADFATIYNSAPLIAASNDGTGQTIAIVGETNINPQDVLSFRQIFGLPVNFPASNIILNGEDPGITSLDEESEADLDVQWSGAVAPGATVKFVVSASTPASAGIDLSALYIIEHNLAGVMSESYGACEQAIGATGNTFYNSLWEQAAAQGITVALSSGDGGSAGCDDFNSESAATIGLAVSGFASTPFNVAVGGTDFDQSNQQSTYWNPTNNPTTGLSVKGYIPEIPWNQSCAQMGLTACTNAQQQYQNIVAGSGGPSSKYSKPAWQMGVTGMPSDSKRDLPDISLFASPGFNGTGYIVCQQDVNAAQTCDLSGFFDFSIIGGTSASSPSFAGVMALVNQYQAAHGGSPRQGNANYVLYALAKKSGASCTSAVGEAAGCIFNDVTHGNSGLTGNVGTNSVPCQSGTVNCSVATGTNVGVLVDNTKKEAWTTNAGYDLVTGLGSLNVQNLAQNWGSVSTVATTTTLTLTPATGITHGTTENVAVGITVTPASGTPTGVVSLIANMQDGSTRGVDNFLLANGTITGAKTQNLPGGTYTVTAHYAGDGTNAPSDSAPVSVTVAPESSQTFIVIPTFDSVGQQTSGNGSSVPYGSSYIIRMYVTDKTGTLNPTGAPGSTCDKINLLTCPTGSVALASNGTPVDQGTFSLNSAGYTRDIVPTLQGGTYSLVATYGGDSSFTASPSAAHAFTVTPAATQMSGPFISGPSPALIGIPVSLSSQMGANVFNGAAPGGTITFFDGTTALPGTVTLTPAAGTSTNAATLNGSLTATFSTTGSHTISAKYSGDGNFAPSVSAVSALGVVNATTIMQTENTQSIQFGQSVTANATVASTSKSPALTGSIGFFTNNGVLSGNTTVAGTDASGNQTLTSSITFMPQGSAFLYAFYQGDPNYASAQSNSDLINVNIPDFSLQQDASVSVTAGQTATTTFTITPATNTPSPVTLTVGNQPFSGGTITLNPASITLNGAPVPVTVSVSTMGSGGSQTVRRAQLKRSGFLPFSQTDWWSTAAASAAMFLFLLGYPARRRTYRAAFLAGLICVISVAIGCGGGSSGGGGGGITKVASTTMITAPSAKVVAGAPYTLTATVTSSKSPTGSVTFSNSGTQLGPAVPLVNGVATFSSSQSFPVGMFSFTAQYSGDTNNLSSQSATAASMAFTGSMSVAVIGQTGTLQRFANINVTLQ
jgi:hypothetical protein